MADLYNPVCHKAANTNTALLPPKGFSLTPSLSLSVFLKMKSYKRILSVLLLVLTQVTGSVAVPCFLHFSFPFLLFFFILFFPPLNRTILSYGLRFCNEIYSIERLSMCPEREVQQRCGSLVTCGQKNWCFRAGVKLKAKQLAKKWRFKPSVPFMIMENVSSLLFSLRPLPFSGVATANHRFPF